ncbi:polysaccharide deacetylase family protein [Actinosynnema sp. NPDC002837]
MSRTAATDAGRPVARGVRRRVAALAGAVGLLGALAVVLPNAASAADCSSGYVALTYDDGPKAGTTTQLLNALRSAGLRATFFNQGNNVQANPALTRSQRDAGMWVENHSWSHPHMTQLSQAQMTSEISQTQQAIQSATGVAPKLFRPPYGETNSTLKAVEAQFGLTEVLWNVDSRDWNNASTAQIVQAASTLQNGGVILMHDGYQTTINAVPQIAANLASRNLCAGMISPSTGRAVAPSDTPPTSTTTTTTTTTTTSTTTTTTSTTTPPTGACTASYRTVNSWQGGFQADVTVTAGSAITGWTVRWTLASGQTITQVWGGVSVGSGSQAAIRNAAWNGSLGANASTTFGFIATGAPSATTLSCTSP